MTNGSIPILHLHIDPSSGVPIYLQIIEQVTYLIAIRVLRPHDELPSVRALAGQYLINPNTVARAYRELEQGGLIYKKRGMGTYVAERKVTLGRKERFEIVRKLLDKALVQAVELGLSPAEMRQVFRERLAKFDEESRRRRERSDD